MRGTIVGEALLVAVSGLAFAVAGNALSPRGLRLSANYFPDTVAKALPVATRAGNDGLAEQVGRMAPIRSNPAAERLQKKGLQGINHSEAVELFRDPAFAQGQVVFVDARNEQHYQRGHIPGAWPFNHYRAQDYLPALLPICLTALKVVIYCSGGECEDSEFAALILRDAGVPQENLFVYTGGISEWTRRGMSVETGPRREQ